MVKGKKWESWGLCGWQRADVTLGTLESTPENSIGIIHGAGADRWPLQLTIHSPTFERS